MIPVVSGSRRDGSMRSSDLRTDELFSYVDIEDRVPAMVDRALGASSD
jgi:hypothetical protein